MKRFVHKIVLLAFMLPVMVFAVEPDEVLDDAALEARARALSSELRCVVCQSENIDASDAGVARDMRVILREKLTEGLTDAEIRAFFVERYGEFVLLDPSVTSKNLPLWLFGPAVLLIGGFFAFRFISRSGVVPDDE